MQVEIFQVDSFADRPFAGNPAGVCLLEAPASEPWMRAVAAEMNLSETAFLHPEGPGWRLRWFTPTVEVDLCGHATLASAHVLWSESRAPEDRQLHFETKSGPLGAAAGAEGWIELDFPAERPSVASPPSALLDALGLERVEVAARNRMDWLLEVADEAAVRSLAPDFRALARVDARGVSVTSPPGPATLRDHPGVDFVSRFFAPSCGVDEDPVTGSAHCALGPWWSERLGRATVLGRQVSRRGGMVRVTDRGERVTLAGRATTVLRGRIVGART
ncbi:MAG: PhzF family phenazine biosynthesis protein [Gemmatimonadota bacterium]